MRNKPSFLRSSALFGCALLLATAGPNGRAQEPADDLSHLGAQEDILFWSPRQQLASYRNIDKIFATRRIRAGDFIHALPSTPADLDDLQIVTEESTLSLDEYFIRQRVAGLLVIKSGRIAYERYALGNTRDSVWISFSVAKSVTSMLIGAAIADGYIKSVDEKVTDYLPRLKGSSYDQASIRNIMQMSSGVQWDEDYADPESDINIGITEWETVNLYEYLRHKPREHMPGEVFNYNTAETNLVGTLLRSAIGNNLSTYLSEKIWQPFGMEADANWMLTERGGGEWGGCCISATLRDYGRIGLFAINGGVLSGGTQVLPEGWMDESTTPSNGYAGYGYLWWLSRNGSYAAAGIFGQGIHINPAEELVIAFHSAREAASKDTDWALEDALYEALTEALKD